MTNRECPHGVPTDTCQTCTPAVSAAHQQTPFERFRMEAVRSLAFHTALEHHGNPRVVTSPFYMDRMAALEYWRDRAQAERDALVAALEAQEAAELQRLNCEECKESTQDWACCGPCSLVFGKAIDMRSAALKAAKGEA